MPAGEPLKFKTVKDLEDASDGYVEAKRNFKIVSDDFEKEKELSDYIVLNIDLFTEQVLQDKLISFEVEKPVSADRRFGPRGRRMDLFIVCEKKTYLIELKNSKYPADNRYAIGQLLDYGREYLDPKKELVLVTTKFDINTAKTIQYYKLPIRYLYFDKKRTLEVKNES